MFKNLIVTAVLAACFIAGAARAQTTTAEAGVVIEVQPSSAAARESRWDSTGTAVGAALGGLVGYQAGGDWQQRSAAMTVGGAIGAVIGRAVEKRPQKGVDLVIRLDSGQVVALFQPTATVRPGDRVYLVGGERIIPAAPSALAVAGGVR